MIETKIFIRKPLFTQYVQNLKPEFDAAKTTGMYDWSFIDTDGVVVTTRCAKEYFEALNKRFGYFIDADKSTTRRSRWIVTFNDKQDLPTPLISLEAAPVDVSEVELEATTEVIVDNECLSFEEVDWPRLEALKSTKSDKAELDEYASKFGVSLKKNKSITNMLEDFKEAAGVN
jgi:hypothetical protein